MTDAKRFEALAAELISARDRLAGIGEGAEGAKLAACRMLHCELTGVIRALECAAPLLTGAQSSAPREKPEELLAVREFPPALREALADWFEYKRERRDAYKPAGAKALLGQAQNSAEKYGADAVAALIRECMAAGYKGILFDRLSRGKKPPTAAGGAAYDIDEINRLVEAEYIDRVG